MAIYSWFTHQKRWLSMVMFVYQRVNQPQLGVWSRKLGVILMFSSFVPDYLGQNHGFPENYLPNYTSDEFFFKCLVLSGCLFSMWRDQKGMCIFCSPSRVETCWKHQRVVEWYHFSLKKAEKVTWDNGTWPYHSSCRMVSWDIFRFENVNTGALEIFGSIRIQNAENRTRLFPIHVLFYIAPIFF